MRTLSRRERVLIWIAAFMVIGLAGIRLVAEPARNQLQAFKLDLEAESLELRQMQDICGENREIRREYEQESSYFEAHKDHFWEWMSADEAQARLVSDLDVCGIEAVEIKIFPDDEKTAGSVSGGIRAEMTVLTDLQKLSSYLDLQRHNASLKITAMSWNERDMDPETGRVEVWIRLEIKMLRKADR